MSNVQNIKIQPLEEKSFKPFGQVLSVKDRRPTYRGGSASEVWVMDFHTPGTGELSFVRSSYQGMKFRKLERHFQVSQGFIPIGGSPSVVAVAPPTDPKSKDAIPDGNDIRAYLIDGSKGYILRVGTWHTLDRFPLYLPHSDFIFVSDVETTNDLRKRRPKLTQEIDYEKLFGQTFEAIL